MAVILAVLIIISVYVFSFKEDFKDDDIGRVTVFGLVLILVSLLFIVIGSIGS